MKTGGIGMGGEIMRFRSWAVCSASAGVACLCLLVGTQSASSAEGVSNYHGCEALFRKYRVKPAHKAFAMSNFDNANTCGMVWSAVSKDAAAKEALQRCQRISTGGAHCRLTAAE